MTAQAEAPSPRFDLFAYIAPAIPMTVLATPVVLFVPEYYAHHIGLDLAAIGSVFLIVRLLDVGLDVFLGALMDRTRTRLGRYRAWLLAAMPILMLSVAMVFLAQPGVSLTYLWVGLLLLYATQSLVFLAHGAWAAVLSTTYSERARLYTWNQMAGVAGMLLVLLMPWLATSLFPGDDALPMIMMGLFAIIGCPLAVAIAAWRVPEPLPPISNRAANILSSLRDVPRLILRPAVVRILIADLLLAIASGMTGAMFLFFFRDAMGFSTSQANLLMLIYFLGGLVGAPILAKLAGRFGKHRVLAATAVYIAASQAGLLLLPPHMMAIAAPGLFFAGFGCTAAPGLVRAMIADASDEVRLEQGIDRTTLLYAFVISTLKIGLGLAIGVSYVGLGFAGFDAHAGAINATPALHALTAIFIGPPTVLAVIAALVIAGHPLNKARHDAIRRQLAEREASIPQKGKASMSEIAGKVVVITGASSGIGAATAKLLAERGARVVLGARREERLKEIVQEIAARHGQASYAVTDVTKRDSVTDLVQHAQKTFGRIDAMINNAGIMPLSLFDQLKVDEWEQMIDVNIKGVLYGIAAALPVFQAQGGGHIINVASVAGHQVHAGGGVYCATKAAVLAMTEGLRVESGGTLRVTTISPGIMKSEIAESISHPEVKRHVEVARTIAISPEAAARAIAFAIEQPPETNVSEIVIGPTAQGKL
jgi:glycoside/pentoside/hexuronide:cation symporter, GPH family